MSREPLVDWGATPAPAQREYLSTLSFSLTHRCDIACAHCMPSSGLGRSGDMDADLLVGWIGQAARLRPTIRIAFTGGEPFLHRRGLQAGAAACARHGLSASVITNGRWAISPGHATTVLQRMPAIETVGVSVDVYHLAFVDPVRISNLVSAAKALSRRVLVRITYSRARDEDIDKALAALGPAIAYVDDVEAQPLIHTGRAQEELSPADIYDFSTSRVPCLLADAPAVEVDGHVFACCGPAMQAKRDGPLHLGDLNTEPLEQIVSRAHRSIVLQALRTEGPAALWSAVNEPGGKGAAPRGHMCATCLDVCCKGDRSGGLGRLAENDSWSRRIAVRAALELGEVVLLG